MNSTNLNPKIIRKKKSKGPQIPIFISNSKRTFTLKTVASENKITKRTPLLGSTMKRYLENLMGEKYVLKKNVYLKRRLDTIVEDNYDTFYFIDWSFGKFIYAKEELKKIIMFCKNLSDSMILNLGTQLMKSNYDGLSDEFVDRYFFIYFTKDYTSFIDFPLMKNPYFTSFHKRLIFSEELSKKRHSEFKKYYYDDDDEKECSLEQNIIDFLEKNLFIKYLSGFDNIVADLRKHFETSDKSKIDLYLTYFYLYDRYDFSDMDLNQKIKIAKIIISIMNSFTAVYDNTVYNIPNAAVNLIKKILSTITLSKSVISNDQITDIVNEKTKKKSCRTPKEFRENVEYLNPINRLLFYFILEFSKHDYTQDEVKEFIMIGLKYGSAPFLHLIKTFTADELIFLCTETELDKTSLLEYFDIDYCTFSKIYQPLFFNNILEQFDEKPILLNHIISCYKAVCKSRAKEKKIERIKEYSEKEKRLNYLTANKFYKYYFYDLESIPSQHKKMKTQETIDLLKEFIGKNLKKYYEQDIFNQGFLKKFGLKVEKVENVSSYENTKQK